MKPDPVMLVALLSCTIAEGADDASAIDGDANGARPSLRQQCLIEKQSGHSSFSKTAQRWTNSIGSNMYIQIYKKPSSA
jgi:hypothetical protein